MDVADRGAPVTLPAVWLMPDVPRVHQDSPHRLTWDGAIVERLLDELGAQHVVGFDALPADADGAVVVIPGGYYADQVTAINDDLARLAWCLVIVCADEGATFPDQDLKHDNMRVWRQAPRPGVHSGDRFLPMGPPPRTSELLAEAGPQERVFDWGFAGQVNHRHRLKCVEALSRLPQDRAYLAPTRRFASGMSRPDYLAQLARTKVAPCPSGPVSADSFRVWEALEAGCVPVVDGSCPEYGPGFWSLLGAKVATVDAWGEFGDLLPGLLAGWPANSTRAWAWWMGHKRALRKRLEQDIRDLAGEGYDGISRHPTTVLMPTSPIPSHPSTEIVEQTVATVRHHLPDAEIILMCDGVRPEQEHRRADYEAYLNRLMWLCAHQWGNTVPLVFDEHQHQANMTRQALDLVDTPTVTFVEHDTPLCADEHIDWDACYAAIASGFVNTVRFHFESVIPEPHKYLMIDRVPKRVAGLHCIRTRQWSQRPHVTSTAWYRRMLADPAWFPPDAVTMIEDVLNSPVMHQRWEANRVVIYAERGGHLKRSWNLDGRKDDDKFPMQYGTRVEA